MVTVWSFTGFVLYIAIHVEDGAFDVDIGP